MIDSTSNAYKLQFNPIFTGSEGGEKQLARVEAIGVPISGERPWRANFHSLEDLLAALESKLGLPGAQLDGIRENLSSGKLTELGGHVSGAERLVGEEQLRALGLVLRSPRLPEEAVPEPQWGAGAPKGARTVFSRMIKEGANVPLFLGQTVVNALRDLGYNNTTSAICEHIDNSFQWGATEARVYFYEKGKKGARKIEVLILDNGVGMSPNVLRAVTAFGGSLCYDNRGTIGKYGMGMKAAALSIGPALEIYSWQEGSGMYRMILDTEEIANDRSNVIQIPEPVPIDILPAEVREILVQPMTFPKNTEEQDLLANSDEELEERLGSSGTIIYIPDCDRLTHHTAKALTDHATREMARIYRRFLARGHSLYVNNRRVEPFDPTYRMENARHTAVEGVIEKQSRLVRAWEIPIPIEEGSETTKTATVRLFLLPIEQWDQLPRKVLKNDLRVFDNTGISFMRNGREVYIGPHYPVTGKLGRGDSWWRIEVDFPADLDEAMGEAINKQGVRPKQYVNELIRDEIKADLANVRSRIDQHWSERAAVDASKSKISEAEQRANEGEAFLSTVLPERRLTDDEKTGYEAELRTFATAFKREAETDEDAYQRIRGSKYVTTFKHDPDAAFYRVDYRLGKVVLTVNTAHPFFNLLYKPLAEVAKRTSEFSTSDSDDVTIDPELVKSCGDVLLSLELLLLSLARTQSAITINDTDGDRQRMFDQFRRQWSLNLETLLNLH